VHDSGEVTRPAHDRDVTVPVGAKERHTQPGHLGEQDGRRMPVIVVQADADHRDGRMSGGEECRVGVGGAVMRNLEHVGPQIRARVQQRALRVDLRVAGEQDANALDLGSQHE
jgi:hypothetical protein